MFLYWSHCICHGVSEGFSFRKTVLWVLQNVFIDVLQNWSWKLVLCSDKWNLSTWTAICNFEQSTCVNSFLYAGAHHTNLIKDGWVMLSPDCFVIWGPRKYVVIWSFWWLLCAEYGTVSESCPTWITRYHQQQVKFVFEVQLIDLIVVCISLTALS